MEMGQSPRGSGTEGERVDSGTRPVELGIGKLFGQVRDSVIVVNAESQQIVLWNPAAEKVFGYSLSEALGMRVEALVPAYSHIDSGTLLELPAIRKDGLEIRVELSLNPLESIASSSGTNGSEKEERYVMAVMRDVTRRKDAEDSLKDSEERRRGLADAAFEGILITDGGEILDANRALFEMLGYEPGEAIGHSALEFIAPEHQELVQKNILTGYEEPYEITGIRKDGVRVELEVRGRAFSYRRRSVRVTALRDIGERKKAQEAQARLAAIVESSDDAIIGSTFDSIITSWNSGARKIYGYAAEEVLGKSVSILAPPGHPDDVTEIIKRVHKGERVESYETDRVRKDGISIHVSITASLILDYSGETIGVSTIERDVTERITAEQEIRCLNQTLEKRVEERTERLAESERRLKELVGKIVVAQEEERRSVAYDIHDGLTQVAIAAHQTLQVFAQKHPPGTPVEEGSLDRTLALAQRVVREARHVIEELRPTSLDDFGLVAALRLEIEELQKEGWEVACEEDLGEERLESETETALYRVAMEALANARKHSRTTRAAIKLSRQPRVVRLEVKDEGRGFDMATSFRRGRGEKVGLAGMRERVALLGGSLKINSRPGKGTTVIAEIPLEASSLKKRPR